MSDNFRESTVNYTHYSNENITIYLGLESTMKAIIKRNPNYVSISGSKEEGYLLEYPRSEARSPIMWVKCHSDLNDDEEVEEESPIDPLNTA